MGDAFPFNHTVMRQCSLGAASAAAVLYFSLLQLPHSARVKSGTGTSASAAGTHVPGSQ